MTSKRDLHIQQSYAKETHICVNEAILHLMQVTLSAVRIYM